MNRLDWTVIASLLVILALLGGILVIGNPIPLNVTCFNAGGCMQAGPFASISLEFSYPVDAQLVQNLWTVSPPVTGRWYWQDDRRARWQAEKPFSIGERITFQLSNGPAGKNGEQVRNPLQWEVEIRRPAVVFLLKQGQGDELYSIQIGSGESNQSGAIHQITHTKNNLVDYDVSTDGEQIVYSAINEKRGSNIWIIGRDGNAERILLDCNTDRCTTPAWSPVTNEIAYTRESSGLDPNGPPGAPRIWIANVDTGQTTPLLADPQQIGYGPNWSPDGKKLSIWNGTMGGIEIVDRGSGDVVLLPTPSGDTGCWSPDSRLLYYSDIFSKGNDVFHNIQKADLVNGTKSLVLGNQTGESEYGFAYPICHPRKELIGVSVQKNGTMLNSEIDILYPEGKFGQLIVDDPSKTFSNYSWNSDGSYMVLQAFRLGGKANETEIWIWEEAQNRTWKLLDGARLPKLLP